MNRLFLHLIFIITVFSNTLQVLATQNPSLQTSPTIENKKQLHFKTIHGDLIIDDPLIIELIESPLMQRLKGINQYGADEFIRPKKKYTYTRFDHSLGVYQILKQHGASRQEQVAGLLHDASHTVFSHTTDMLFMGGMDKGAYQDKIHHEFLLKFGAQEILARYGFTIDNIMPDRPDFLMLEQHSPALCADRIEYIIHAGDLENILTPQEIQEIHKSLHFKNGNWYFDNAQVAEKFALISLDQSIKTWGSPQAVLIPQLIGKAIAHLLETNIISYEDVHFNLNDQQLWNILEQSKDPIIKELISKALTIDSLFRLISDEEIKQGIPHDVLRSKFRGVDPWVEIKGEIYLLKTISPTYWKKYSNAQKLITNGWRIQRTEKM